MTMISEEDQIIRIYGRTDSSLLFRFIRYPKSRGWAGTGICYQPLGIVGVWNDLGGSENGELDWDLIDLTLLRYGLCAYIILLPPSFGTLLLPLLAAASEQFILLLTNPAPPNPQPKPKSISSRLIILHLRELYSYSHILVRSASHSDI